MRKAPAAGHTSSFSIPPQSGEGRDRVTNDGSVTENGVNSSLGTLSWFSHGVISEFG
jgi:hypothetical protein